MQTIEGVSPDSKKPNYSNTNDSSVKLPTKMESSDMSDEDDDDYENSDNDDQENDEDNFSLDTGEDSENYSEEDYNSKVIFVDLNAPKKPKNQTVFMDSGRKKSSPKKLDTIIVYD